MNSVPSTKEIEQNGKCRRGKTDYLRYKRGKRLTRSQSILAYCYECNGYGELKECHNRNCPLWPYHEGKELPNPLNEVGVS